MICRGRGRGGGSENGPWSPRPKHVRPRELPDAFPRHLSSVGQSLPPFSSKAPALNTHKHTRKYPIKACGLPRLHRITSPAFRPRVGHSASLRSASLSSRSTRSVASIWRAVSASGSLTVVSSTPTPSAPSAGVRPGAVSSSNISRYLW